MQGLRILRTALSEKNDLWIDLGDCYFVIVTNENDEESWRIFSPGTNGPHIVATDLRIWLDM